MGTRRIAGAASFLEAARPLLLEDEARHNLIFGICATLLDDPLVYPEFHLWVVSEEDEVVGAAVMTPPFNLVVARPRDNAALERLAESLAQDGLGLPGVIGALPEAEQFASAWQALSGVSFRLRMRQHIYRAARVKVVEGVGGHMRTATPEDRTLVLNWMRAFSEELGDVNLTPARLVDQRLQTGGFILWEDGKPVSVAGFGGQTPHGVRINLVYTPPELRRRGYASALVAALTARLLSEGRTFCFLYTDAANPTANRIYQSIGYEKICDSADFAFESPPRG